MVHCSNPLRSPSTGRGTVLPLIPPAPEAPEPEPEVAPAPSTSPDAGLIAAAQAYVAANHDYERVINERNGDDPRLTVIAKRESDAMEQVIALPAQTVAGLRAKAQACLHWCPASPAEAEQWESADTENQIIWSLANDVRRLAGNLEEATRPDPILGLIEASRAAHHAVDHTKGGTDEEAEDRFRRYQQAFDELCRAEPRTPEGALALVAYLHEHDAIHQRGEAPKEVGPMDAPAVLAVAARAAARFVPGARVAVPPPCPVEAMGRRYQALRDAEAAAGEAAVEGGVILDHPAAADQRS